AAQVILEAHDGDLRGLRVLLPRAAVAREVLPDTLRGAGAEVDVVHAYQNVPAPAEDEDAIRRAILDRTIDVVTFTAPSTVENVVRMLGDRAAEALAPLTIASIGPITTAAAEKLGVRVDVTAATYTSDGLVDALRDRFARGTSAAGDANDAT
ncbi:MAG: uroporphyrinogen-III synthase, partial [Myxococcota bacterium]|nr:uroporphyrinogen-III synthase [Myxococcota bacterium]